MEYLPDQSTFFLWLHQYGSIALFILLALGILALPVPEETMMVFAGISMAQGKLALFPTIIAAYAGAICGITMSYGLGCTAGSYLVHRYGSKIGLTEAKLAQAHNWFERFGTWALFFGYFIPGVRHFTGFCAGTSELGYREFALFAYLGALVWVSTFLAGGYFLGEHGLALFKFLEGYTDEVFTLFILVAALYIGYKLKKYYSQ